MRTRVTDQERYIISRAVDTALCFDMGILSTCKEAIEDYGCEWNDRLEKHVFETYIEGRGR